jgi:hypothetical protein
VRRRNKSEEKKNQSFYFSSSSQHGFSLHSFFIPSTLFLPLFTSSFFWFQIPLPLIPIASSCFLPRLGLPQNLLVSLVWRFDVFKERGKNEEEEKREKKREKKRKE